MRSRFFNNFFRIGSAFTVVGLLIMLVSAVVIVARRLWEHGIVMLLPDHPGNNLAPEIVPWLGFALPCTILGLAIMWLGSKLHPHGSA